MRWLLLAVLVAGCNVAPEGARVQPESPKQDVVIRLSGEVERQLWRECMMHCLHEWATDICANKADKTVVAYRNRNNK